MGETLGWFPKETPGSFYNIKSKPQSKFPSMWDFFSHMGEIVLEELLERKVVLVLKIEEKLLKTVCTAWRHGAGR